MISQIFPRLTKFAWFRRFIWKRLYNKMARDYPTENWTFMNYGYAYLEDKDSVTIGENDEVNRYSIQLYHSLIQQVDHQSKTLLEVGSGRGGGSNYIAGMLTSGTITGMDLADESVAFCERNYDKNNLSYVVGNSESMPFENESFDIVINVESSHAYGSVDKFLQEVRRVLKNSGYFLLTDFRDAPRLKILKEQLASSGLTLISETNITENVVKAINEEDKIKRARIEKYVPGRLNEIFGEFAGVTGSRMHKGFSNGEIGYYQFVLQKL